MGPACRGSGLRRQLATHARGAGGNPQRGAGGPTGPGPVDLRLRIADVGPGHPRGRDQDRNAHRPASPLLPQDRDGARVEGEAGADGGVGRRRRLSGPCVARSGARRRSRDRDPVDAGDDRRSLYSHVPARGDPAGAGRGADLRDGPEKPPLCRHRPRGGGQHHRQRLGPAGHQPRVFRQPRHARRRARHQGRCLRAHACEVSIAAR